MHPARNPTLTRHQGAPFVHKNAFGGTGQPIIQSSKTKTMAKQHHLAERQQAGSGLIRLLNVPGRTWRSLNVSVKQPDRHEIPEGVTINVKGQYYPGTLYLPEAG